MREIIVDNFAGGGGASTGIELAIGRSVDIAINHDENAIAMHKTNHPDTLHYCESVFDVDPVAATGGNPVGLAWFSPDCRHFSKAKGAKPVKKEIRGLAWIVLRWALAKRPRVMMLENVEEFKTWGPLLADEMRPDPARTGETFNAFVGMLSTGIPADHPALAEVCEFLSIERGSEQAQKLVDGLGYDVDYRELRACDYGAPTIRKRFFMVMRCDGCPIQWPAVTHGDPKSLEVQSGRLMPWRTAAECIDWNVPALSIFDRKKPLAENTLKRIARGIQRFVIESASPFIVKCNHTSTKTSYDCFRGQKLDEPLQTITKTHGYALAVPHLTKFRTGATGQPVTEPVPTVTAGTSKRPGGNGHALGIVEAALTPFLAGIYCGSGYRDPRDTSGCGQPGCTRTGPRVLAGGCVADFDNLFDAAITQADDNIRQVMGTSATVTSGAISGVTLSGVFDDPENIGYATPGIRVEGTSPSLFVKSATIGQLARLDTLDINGKPFWVDRIGPDDCGSCHIWLGTGSPPAATRRR